MKLGLFGRKLETGITQPLRMKYVLLFEVSFPVHAFKDTLEPQNTLAPNALEWCKSVGSEACTVQEAIDDAAVAKAVQVSRNPCEQ